MLIKVDLTLEGRKKKKEMRKGIQKKKQRKMKKRTRDKKQRIKHRNYEEIPMAARKRGKIDGHRYEGKKEGMKENKSSE